MKRKYLSMMALFVMCSMLAGCQSGTNDGTEGETGHVDYEESENEQQDQNEAETESQSSGMSQMGWDREQTDKMTVAGLSVDRLIEDQTFDVELESMGKVTFASFEPDKGEDPYGDVVFALFGDNDLLFVLDGPTDYETRTDRTFAKVEAVSFPDYNSDGYEDIITICSYDMTDENAEESVQSEVRIYEGGSGQKMTYQMELSEETDSALAEKTVQSVLGFLGVGNSQTDSEGEPQQADQADQADQVYQAYIDYINSIGVNGVGGYEVIYLDEDDIPELVVIGDCEAAGCRIVSYYEGEVHENYLSRLYFSYIEKGNLLCNSDGHMDYYYDIVYKLEKGELIAVGEGYYGAEDNSNVQYDEAGDPIYVYEWNGKQVTEEEYDQALDTLYDWGDSQNGYEWGEYHSADEIIDILNSWM